LFLAGKGLEKFNSKNQRTRQGIRNRIDIPRCLEKSTLQSQRRACLGGVKEENL